MPSALTGRSPRTTACHDRSAAPWATARSATKTPAPGRVTTSPSPASVASARDTVTGLTWGASTSDRDDGRGVTGGPAAYLAPQPVRHPADTVILVYEDPG